jgi:hypothetical protein
LIAITSSYLFPLNFETDKCRMWMDVCTKSGTQLNSHVVCAQKLLHRQSRVNVSAVVLEKPPSIPFLRTFSLHIFVQTPRNICVEMLTDGLPLSDEFLVHSSMSVSSHVKFEKYLNV